MQDTFLCRYCENELAHRDNVEPDEQIACENCGTDYTVGENEHPHFAVTLVKAGGPE